MNENYTRARNIQGDHVSPVNDFYSVEYSQTYILGPVSRRHFWLLNNITDVAVLLFTGKNKEEIHSEALYRQRCFGEVTLF